MKKIVSLVLAIAMLLAILPNIAAMAEGEKTTLKVVSWDVYSGSAAWHAAIKDGFEAAYPNVEIEYVDLVSGNEYATVAGVQLAGGDTSDVYFIKEIPQIQQWSDQGFLANLDELVAEVDLSGLMGMENNLRASDGLLYALPFRSDFWVMFYNKDIFNAAGVPYPTNDWTWAEYVEIAEQLTQGEGIDKVYGTYHHTWLSAAVNWAVCDGVYTFGDGNYDPLKYFYEMIQELEDAGACMEYSEIRALGIGYRDMIYGGDTAMLPMGTWLVGGMINEKAAGTFDFDWSFASVPHKDDIAAKSTFGNLTGVSINKNATNPDVAWEFVKWLSGEEGAKAIAAVGTRPAYVSDAVVAAYSSVVGFPTDATALDALLPNMVSIEVPPGAKVPELMTIVNQEHSLIMTDEVTIDEGIASMNERAAEVMAD
ncbi:MAG: extracellular solute-binding protein [Clostridiales bacterium]|nr:extracellular solute-binding protein [Clostridiales bacterium]